MLNRPVRVAYLSYDGLTDPLGQSQILPYILGLERKGFEFEIFSFEKLAAFSIGKLNTEKIIADKKIRWNPLPYHKKPPVLSTLFDIYLLNKELLKQHTKNSFDIIHCRSYITALVGLRMKRRVKTKFLFDMRGFWADERVEGGLWNLKNPFYNLIYKYFKKKEKEFLTEADHTISLTENAKLEILSWKLSTVPITVIPTCVDLELFNPQKIKKEDQEELRAQLGIKNDDFVLLYLGSWGTWYLTKEMLGFFSEIRKQKSQAKFLIVSMDKIELGDYPDKIDVIITSASRHRVPLYISLANTAVFFIKQSFSKKASSATKLGEIIAMSIPVITNKGWGDVEKLSKLGIQLIDMNERDLGKEVEKAISIEKEKLKLPAENLSLSNGIHLFESVYIKIL